MSVQAVGLIAGTLTTAAWIPQLTRTWRSRSADDLSWTYLLTFAGGVSTWLVYGALTGDLPVLAANAVSAALILALVQVKSGPRLRGRAPTGRPRAESSELAEADVRQTRTADDGERRHVRRPTPSGQLRRCRTRPARRT